MTTHLTTDDVATTLARLAREHPDRDGSGDANGSPSRCRYLYDNGTRCIAGQVLHDLGVDSELYDTAQEEISIVLEEHGITHDQAALAMLAAAQDKQDLGYFWKTAVELAFDSAGITHPKGA